VVRIPQRQHAQWLPNGSRSWEERDLLHVMPEEMYRRAIRESSSLPFFFQSPNSSTGRYFKLRSCLILLHHSHEHTTCFEQTTAQETTVRPFWHFSIFNPPLRVAAHLTTLALESLLLIPKDSHRLIVDRGGSFTNVTRYIFCCQNSIIVFLGALVEHICFEVVIDARLP
jgi:hypothetical protein